MQSSCLFKKYELLCQFCLSSLWIDFSNLKIFLTCRLWRSFKMAMQSLRWIRGWQGRLETTLRWKRFTNYRYSVWLLIGITDQRWGNAWSCFGTSGRSTRSYLLQMPFLSEWIYFYTPYVFFIIRGVSFSLRFSVLWRNKALSWSWNDDPTQFGDFKVVSSVCVSLYA